MKQYIFSAVCLMSGALCMSSCNEDKQAKPYTPDYEIVPEYTNADTWTAYEAFNDNLLDPDKNIYKTSTAYTAATDRNNGAAAIWCQPIYWDMAMNAYKRAKAEGDTERENKYKQLCDDLFAGNKAHYVNFDFDDNNENTGWFIYDDIQWWTITLARAYELFKVEEFRSLAEASFARVWYGSPRVGDTGSYADPEKNLGGGMFWQWQPIGNPNENAAGDGKMACINFPTVVAALTLYNNVPADRVADPNPESWSNKYGDFTRPHYETKEAYLAKGKEIYEWAVKNLVDSNTGEVADSKHGEGNPAWSDHVYNQATFIGAVWTIYSFYIQAVPGEILSTPVIEIGWAFCTINCVLLTTGTFLIFTCINRPNPPRILTEASKLSYGMYLMHIFWLGLWVTVFKHTLALPTVAAIPCIAVSTFICCFVTAKIISFIPGSKWIIG